MRGISIRLVLGILTVSELAVGAVKSCLEELACRGTVELGSVKVPD